MTWAIIPWGPGLQVTDLNIGILYLLAFGAIPALGVTIAGALLAQAPSISKEAMQAYTGIKNNLTKLAENSRILCFSDRALRGGTSKEIPEGPRGRQWRSDRDRFTWRPLRSAVLAAAAAFGC